jgi:hypothetical protein
LLDVLLGWWFLLCNVDFFLFVLSSSALGELETNHLPFQLRPTTDVAAACSKPV